MPDDLAKSERLDLARSSGVCVWGSSVRCAGSPPDDLAKSRSFDLAGSSGVGWARASRFDGIVAAVLNDIVSASQVAGGDFDSRTTRRSGQVEARRPPDRRVWFSRWVVPDDDLAISRRFDRRALPFRWVASTVFPDWHAPAT